MTENKRNIRAFIAIILPDEIKQHLSLIQRKFLNSGINPDIRSDIRASFPKAESLHLTLKFLGNISVSDINKIKNCMEKAVVGIPVHSLFVSGIGVFPSVKNVRIIWAGLSGRIELTEKLAKQLEAHLFEDIDIQKEAKVFRPHLTLARVKSKIPPAKAIQQIKEFSTISSPEFSVTGISLFKSELAPSGAIHEQIYFRRFLSKNIPA
jgi:RNA 2',3'-cyclic 3'-phosphodiesterase